jgi:hypothetical protein
MNLRGKTREQVEVALAHKSRPELIDLIFSLLTVEQLLKPSEIATRSCLNKRAVLRDIRDGKFGDYFVRAENSIAVPASGVNTWRNNFRVPAKQKPGAGKMKNPIAAQKKRRFDFYTRSFSKVPALIARRNPSARRKSFPNTDDTRFLSFWRNATGNTRKIDSLVTTSHLFWPNERRRPAMLLPIRLPNPSFPGGKYNKKPTGPRGAVSRVYPPRRPRTEKLIRNFCPNGRISHLA